MVYGPVVAHGVNIKLLSHRNISIILFWYNGRSVKMVDNVVILLYCRASVIFENAS